MKIKLGYETEAAYWAGFIDGEGCISIYKHFNKDGFHKSPSYRIQVGVATTNEEIMNKLSKFAGHGKITRRIFKRENQRDAFYWACRGDLAMIFLKKILPYLKLKVEQAKLCIEFQDNKNSPNINGGVLKPLTQDELKYREDMMIKIRDVNALNSNKGKYWKDKKEKNGKEKN